MMCFNMAYFLRYKLFVLVFVVSYQCQMPAVARDEESCKFNFSQGQLVFNDDNRIISTPGHQATLHNGTKLHIKCLKGYSLEVMTDEGFLKVADHFRGTSVCQSGFWKPKYECSAGGCDFHVNNSVNNICYVVSNTSIDVCMDDDFRIQSGSSLSMKCNEGFELFRESDQTYTGEERLILTCAKGKHLPEYLCKPKRCILPEMSNMTTQDSTPIISINSSFVESGQSINVSCEQGHQLVGASIVECINGEWANEYPVCWREPCEFNFSQGQLVSNEDNTIVSTPGLHATFQNKTKLYIECLDGYSLEIVSDDGIKEGASLVKGISICQSGVFKPIYQCSAACKLSSDHSYMYKTLDGVEVDPGSFINHGTKINIYCRNEGFVYDYYTYEGVDTDTFSQIDCVNGRLGKISLNCRNGDPETCNILENGLVKRGLKNEYIVSCKEGYSLNLLRSDKPYCECRDDHLVCTNEHQKDQTPKCEPGCKLPTDVSVLYKTMDGRDVEPGSFINHGTRLEIYCHYVDIGDYSYDSEVDNDVMHIDCFNGQLGHINLNCKEGDPERCTSLENGSVKRRFFNEYEVACKDGYALNLMRPDIPYCECRDDRLVCQYGGQTPKCVPEQCKIPFTFDDRLTIFIRRGGNIISLSGGVTVQIGETLFFNCINTNYDNLEPNNRRFKCANGKWLEDEKDKTWELGNNGDFPTCRNTSCLPVCKNGGKCIRDGICQCPHLTSGRSCEDVLCDDDCKRNRGTCIAPGTCGRCPKGQYGQNCQHHGCAPPVDAPTIKSPKEVYKIGEIIESAQFDCKTDHVLKPENGMSCSSEGWTEAAKCIPNMAKRGGDWTGNLYLVTNAELCKSCYMFDGLDLCNKMSDLIDLTESVISVSAYKTKLSFFQITSFVFYHMFIIFETDNWYYSIEKDSEGITLQRSKELNSLLQRTRNGKRNSAMLVREDSGRKCVRDVIMWIYQENELQNKYDYLDSNCKHFSKKVYDLFARNSRLHIVGWLGIC